MRWVIVTSLVRSITITVHITPALHSITRSLKPPDADPSQGRMGLTLTDGPISISWSNAKIGRESGYRRLIRTLTIIKEVTRPAS